MTRLLLLLAIPVLAGASSPQNGFVGPVLAAHQAERASVGVPALVWDERLAAGATRWARHLARTGALQHEVAYSGDAEAPGENLWMGTHAAWSPGEMVADWAREKRQFRPGVFPNVSRSGGFAAVGHYTQMVWRRTRYLGCGIATDGDMDYLVCRYATPGNVYGERVY